MSIIFIENFIPSFDNIYKQTKTLSVMPQTQIFKVLCRSKPSSLIFQF